VNETILRVDDALTAAIGDPAAAGPPAATPPAPGGAPTTTTATNQPSPLFLAEVDEVDTSAVLALLSIIPTDEGKGLRIFERRDGMWKEVPQYVQKFKSISPPTVVELDRQTLLAVVAQLDQSDSGKGEKKESAESSATEPVPSGKTEPYPVPGQPTGEEQSTGNEPEEAPA
jgi:hypothetical protein